MGVNHTTMVSRLTNMAFEVFAVVIRQHMPCRTACGRWFWVRRGSDHVKVVLPASLL